MCRGPIFSICSVWSVNTLPQLEQSSLHPSTVLHYRLLLQTTCYNNLSLLLYLLISSKEKNKQQQETPLAGGLRIQIGLRPFNPVGYPLQKSITNLRLSGAFNPYGQVGCSHPIRPPSKGTSTYIRTKHHIHYREASPVCVLHIVHRNLLLLWLVEAYHIKKILL